MTLPYPPDLTVIWCFRTTLSMFGLFALIVGLWKMEKQWDDKAAHAYQRAKENGGGGDYQAPHDDDADDDDKNPDVEESNEYQPAPDGNRTRITTTRTTQQQETTVIVPPDELKAALPLPFVMIAGLGLWSLSFIFTANGGFALDISGWSLVSMLLVGFIGYIFVFPLRKATWTRNTVLKKQSVSIVLLLTALLAFTGRIENSLSIWFLSIFGVFFFFAGYRIMWQQRTMGATWDLEGKPNPRLVVQNPGGMLLIFGLFLLWVGTSAVGVADYRTKYIPIYISGRSFVAFLAGLFITVPATMAMEYAFDEGSQVAPRYYSLDGTTFTNLSGKERVGTVVESPTLYLAGWSLLGLCCFLPFGGGYGFTAQRLFGLLLCLAASGIYTVLVQPAFWNADSIRFKRAFYSYAFIMAILALTVGIHSGVAVALSFSGTGLILAGQKLTSYDRKTGDVWLQSETNNSNPIMLGPGQPIYMIGWILLCLAISLPM